MLFARPKQALIPPIPHKLSAPMNQEQATPNSVDSLYTHVKSLFD